MSDAARLQRVIEYVFENGMTPPDTPLLPSEDVELRLAEIGLKAQDGET